MKRLGQYSGKIYEENEVKNMNECGILITDEQAKDENWIKEHHVKDLLKCITCCDCPLAQKGVIGN